MRSSQTHRGVPAPSTTLLTLLATTLLLLPLRHTGAQALTPTNHTHNNNNNNNASLTTTTAAMPTTDDNSNNDNDYYYDDNMTVPGDLMKLFKIFRPEVIFVEKYVTIFIYCVGFPGNILSFIVWIQKRMRHSSGCYLAALALDDFIFLSLHVVFELHTVWGWKPLDTPVFCQIFPIIFLCAQYLGPLLVLGFTTERYISICHPFKREKYCTVRRAKLVIGILVGSAVALSGVQGYFYTMHHVNATDSYECGPRPEVSQDGNTSLLILWNLSIEILTFMLVPLTVLVLNIRVISEMRRLSRMEQVTLHGHSQRTSATTVMLLVVSFYLILTTLPVTIIYTLFYEFEYDIYSVTMGQARADSQFHRWLNYQLVLAAIKEFGTTQYAFNIVFYVITGKVFRKELKRLFVKVLCGKVSLSISREYSSLRSSLRREGSKTKSAWVSINGHNNSSGTKTTTTTTTTTATVDTSETKL
ncbi:FMRFamide receptor-like [Babylonia areolata]|uniref:FMRFamide receptor-like n=1 Tax=Babylonia areolata TaxID=304850 RepID=UPI003FD39CD6